MFDHFTFGAQAQTHFHQQDESSASPTDTSGVPTQPAPTSQHYPDSFSSQSMDDILRKLTDQTLVPDENETAESSSCTDTLSSPAFKDTYLVDSGYSYRSAHHGLRTMNAPYSTDSSTSGSDVASRRLQRQLNTQLQCCTNHVKDITSLVEEMISTNSQCTVHPSASSSTPLVAMEPPPLAPPVEALEDEGFCEIDSIEALDFLIQRRQQQEQERDDNMSFRRAGTPSGMRQLGGGRYLHGVGLKNYYGGDGGESVAADGISTYVPREQFKGMIQRVPRMRMRKENRLDKSKGGGRRKRLSQT